MLSIPRVDVCGLLGPPVAPELVQDADKAAPRRIWQPQVGTMCANPSKPCCREGDDMDLRA